LAGHQRWPSLTNWPEVAVFCAPEIMKVRLPRQSPKFFGRDDPGAQHCRRRSTVFHFNPPDVFQRLLIAAMNMLVVSLNQLLTYPDFAFD